MGRPKLNPKRAFCLRIPEDMYAELVILRPDLQDIYGYNKYGALNGYFVQLIRKDLEELKQKIRENAA